MTYMWCGVVHGMAQPWHPSPRVEHQPPSGPLVASHGGQLGHCFSGVPSVWVLGWCPCWWSQCPSVPVSGLGDLGWAGGPLVVLVCWWSGCLIYTVVTRSQHSPCVFPLVVRLFGEYAEQFTLVVWGLLECLCPLVPPGHIFTRFYRSEARELSPD